MPTPNLPSIGDQPSQRQILDYIAKLQRDLEWLLSNLDDLNVTRLTAEVIKTGTLDANVVTIRSDLTGDAYIQIDGNGMVINNGTINTFEADTDGNVTATSITLRNDLSGGAYVQIDNSGMVINNGSFNTFEADINGAVTMTSALIQSASGYPKVVMDPASDLFGAYYDANTYIQMFPDYNGDTPIINFHDGASTDFYVGFYNAQNKFAISHVGGADMEVSTTSGDILLNASSGTIYLIGGAVRVPSWDAVVNSSTFETLQQALDAKATAGASTSAVGNHNHGIPDGTLLAISGGGSVAWSESGGHSHSQT